MNMTVTEYIEQQRLVLARQHLAMTTKPIKEIAAEIGYMDQNYFSRVFKKHTGMSPSAYRNKYKKLC
jgi:two-component system response regulator YesN